MPRNRFTVLLRSTLLTAVLVVAACQTAPPVQEMSDARQAISAARNAGAADHAAAELQAAVELLQSAEQSINTQNYAQARRDALAAKAKAHDALRQSEAGEEDSP